MELFGPAEASRSSVTHLDELGSRLGAGCIEASAVICG
jgi:hypothetical protein